MLPSPQKGEGFFCAMRMAHVTIFPTHVLLAIDTRRVCHRHTSLSQRVRMRGRINILKGVNHFFSFLGEKVIVRG